MDPRRRYLQHLIELGETELVLEGGGLARDGGGLARDGGGRRGRVRRDAEASTIGAQPGVPPGTPAHQAAAVPTGIVVDAPPPSTDLFHVDPVSQLASLEQLARVVEACRKCGLGHTRLHSVPGQGHPQARLVLVGEAPGATEDETGLAFVGRAGQLLTDILRAIDLSREEVFICNVLKCRPPNNRDPEPLEVAACAPYLHRQLELIRPKVILALGKPAANTLLGTTASLGELRGKLHRYRGIPLVVTYHPAALLRNPHWKRPTWDDVRLARRLLDGETG